MGDDSRRFSGEDYGYAATDGRYRVEQYLLNHGIIFQRKIGYARVEDARAEAQALRRLVEQHQLLAHHHRLYICSDLSALEGVTRGARPIVARLFTEEDIEVVVAACGVSPFTRILDRIFQSWRPSLRHHYFDTLQEAEAFLITERKRDLGVRDVLAGAPQRRAAHTERTTHIERELDGVQVTAFSPPHWTYITEDSSLSVTYSLLGSDVLLIEMAGIMDKAEQMLAAQKVAQSVLKEINSDNLYVIRDSRKITRVSLAARRAYLEYAKEASSHELLVLHIGTTLSRMLLRSVKVIAPQTFRKWHPAVTTRKALETIQEHRQENEMSLEEGEQAGSATERYGPVIDLPEQERIIARLVDRLVRMAWDVTFKPRSIDLPDGHLYEELIAALDVLQRDLSEVFLTQESHLEESKRSRERLKQAQSLAHLGSWEWLPESGRSFWSAETYRMFGYGPNEVEPSYELYLEHLHPNSRKRAVDAMQDALENNGSFEDQFTILRLNGSERICRFHGMVDWDRSTGLQTVRVTFIDITDLMKAKQEAEFATSTLQRSEDALRQNLAAMSHDVRTPLTSLKLGLNRLMMGGEAEEIGPALRAEVEHLDTLFANMLSLARLRTGIDETEMIACDLNEVLERIKVRLTVVAQDLGVKVAIAESVEPTVLSMEALAMEQAFTNLVHNAIKFAKANVAILVDPEDEHVVVCIRDDGVGLPTEDSLAGLNAAGLTGIADLRKGLGLGFAIAKAIIGKHSGTLTIGAHPDSGTQVIVKLPR